MSDLAKTIGANITAGRTAAGLSMRELAKAVGASQSSVHYWETAVRNITAVRLAAVAGALGVGVEQLLTDGHGAHVYLSTSCLHGDLVLPDGRTGHEYCQGETGRCGAKTPHSCKFCCTNCVCPCHDIGEDQRDH